MSILEDMISKYGGADEAYKLKLKTHLRNSMGYSNYMTKLGQETGAPADIGDVKGLSPQGIKSRIGSRFGMQKENVNTLGAIAGAFDTAAGSIADKLIAKDKAADKYRYDTSFIYDPKDGLDQKILEYAQNPYNEDGSTKSLQQFEAELNDSFQATHPGDRPTFSQEDIKNRIVEKLPSDYIGKERQYQYRFAGMSEEQATDEMIIDYGNMIVMGRGKEIPPEFYPAAYATLTPYEKAEAQKLKKNERKL